MHYWQLNILYTHGRIYHYKYKSIKNGNLLINYNAIYVSNFSYQIFIHSKNFSYNHLHSFLDISKSKWIETKVSLLGWLYRLPLPLAGISRRLKIFALNSSLAFRSHIFFFSLQVKLHFASCLSARLFKSRTNVRSAGHSVAGWYAWDYGGGIVN